MEKPRTPQDWGLFTASADDGEITWDALNEAAAALSAALDRAEAAVLAGADAYESYDDFIEPVAVQHEEVGAGDTEPREAAVSYLLQLANQQP